LDVGETGLIPGLLEGEENDDDEEGKTMEQGQH
jgi:hypothetical protein